MLTSCVWIVGLVRLLGWNRGKDFCGRFCASLGFVGGILGASLWQLLVGVLFCEGRYIKAVPNIFFLFKSSCVVIACDCLTPGRCFTQMHNDGVGVCKPGTKHFGSTKQCIVVCTVGGGLLLFSDWAEGILGLNSPLLYCNVARIIDDDLM